MTSFTVLRGGAQKVSDPRFSHFVAPPLPVINDQSLNHIVLRDAGTGVWPPYESPRPTTSPLIHRPWVDPGRVCLSRSTKGFWHFKKCNLTSLTLFYGVHFQEVGLYNCGAAT